MDKFGCAINCIDGRAQLPVIDWIKFNGQVQYVDVITAPGMDGLISKNESSSLDIIYQNSMTSIRVHATSIFAVVGHYDCIGNPVSREQHYLDIESSAEVVAVWVGGLRVVGLWVNEFGSMDVVCDTGKQDVLSRSFL